jgi:hypothetical protein
MDTLLAGWIAGYAMALLSTAALTYLAIQGADQPLMRRIAPEGSSPLLVAVPISIGTFVLWTMVGLLLASLYEVADLGEEADALGSPSGPFLLMVAALAFIPLPILIIFWPRRWWLWTGMSLAFLGLFGWMMPILAER